MNPLDQFAETWRQESAKALREHNSRKESVAFVYGLQAGAIAGILLSVIVAAVMKKVFGF